MNPIAPLSPMLSPTEATSNPRNEPSKFADLAHDRVAAILEGSDDEDEDNEPWKSAIASSPLTQSQEPGKPVKNASFDLDLDDEDSVAIRTGSAGQDMDTTEDGDNDDGSRAYARLMKSLYSKPASNPVSVEETAHEPAARERVTEQSDHSDDEMPVTKARLTSKPKIRSSPSHASPQLPRAARSPSLDLFVSPGPVRRTTSMATSKSDESDSDEMPSAIANPKLKALIAKKRAERKEKEEFERKKAQAAQKQQKQFKEIYSSEMDDGMSEDAQRALTENSRPTQRKASRKALEDMNRETQRMARNQQLTHQARVKRKFTTLDFVRSFGLSVDTTAGSHDRPRSRGALDSSDYEGRGAKHTPPSSPPSLGDEQDNKETSRAVDEEDEYIIRTGVDVENEVKGLPNLNKLLSDPVQRVDKGKSKDVVSSPPQRPQPILGPVKTRKQIRVLPRSRAEDSDDDLEIITSKKANRFAVFDNLPEAKGHESTSLLNLRALAHMSPPNKNQRNARHSMTQAELRMRLAKEMHKQTMAEKQERLEVLRARGIVFKTEEEMEEDQMYIENMLEKARKEAMELGRKENEAAKKEGKEIDENYALPSDDESEDGDFEEEDEEDIADVVLSGSEDEELDDAEGEDTAALAATLFDDAAEEAEGEDDEEEGGDTDKEEEKEEDAIVKDTLQETHEDASSPALSRSRAKPRKRNVILDDDEEDELEIPPTPITFAAPQSQTTPINAFGFTVPNASMGLTQMFMGTMAELATQENGSQDTPRGQSLDFLRDAPTSTLPAMSPIVPAAGFLVEASQSYLATPAKQQLDANSTPRFTPLFPTPAGIGSQMSPTKLSEIPEPTQDEGFDSFRMTNVDMPFSTVETVMMRGSVSPVAQKKGKLHRRTQQVAQLSDDEAAESDDEAENNEGGFALTTNAFDALFKANKKPAAVHTFDKKRSEAKNIVADQAEESEDEYAGLGGASDDESDNGVDEEVQKMIDEGPVDVKEAELAKFFAHKDRADDEKRVDKLYRDITTGALRRKRGVGVDELSDDSDDEATERRRQKQREFAKMRKALLEDENVGKIAENPKKLAFLRAIEDRDEDDSIDYFGEMEDLNALSDSQPDAIQDNQQPIQAGDGESVPAATNNTLKRKLPANFANSAQGKQDSALNMSHRRRPAPAEDNMNAKRPTSITEIRESLSFLIDEPLVPDSQVSDHSDEDEEDEDYDMPDCHVRQKRNDGNGSAVLTTVRASVINRLTVSRNNSLSMDEESISSGPVAFHTSSSTSNGSFKVPSLLRRATTNLSNASSTSSGSTTPTTTNENAVRRGGSKKSNIHFQAREAERMKKVQEADRRRREGIRKTVVGKGRISVLGNSLGGRNSGFE